MASTYPSCLCASIAYIPSYLSLFLVGYDGIALTHSATKITPKDICPIPPSAIAAAAAAATAACPPPTYSLVLPAAAAAAFPPTAPLGGFSIRTRLMLSLTDPAQQHALTPSNPALLSYDLVSVRPGNEKLLHAALSSGVVDIISFDLSQRLPFPLRITPVKMALAAGVLFEVCYSASLADPVARRSFFANLSHFAFITRGQNLIFTSGAATALSLRPPSSAAALGALAGLSAVAAAAAAPGGAAGRGVMARAAARSTQKGAVGVTVPGDVAIIADPTAIGSSPAAHTAGSAAAAAGGGGERKRANDAGAGGGKGKKARPSHGAPTPAAAGGAAAAADG